MINHLNIVRLLFFILPYSIISFSYAQTNNRFYATIEDYQSNKYIEGIEIIEKSSPKLFGNETFKVKKGNTEEVMELSQFPSNLFTYKDMLLRVYNTRSYYVLIFGNICYYTETSLTTIQKGDRENEFIVNATYIDHKGNGIRHNIKEYYSETIKGDLILLTDKNWEALLKEHNRFEAYSSDIPKQERGTTYNYFCTKLINRTAFFIDLINKE